MIEEFKCSLVLTFSGEGRGPGWDRNIDSNTKAVSTCSTRNILLWNYQCSIEYVSLHKFTMLPNIIASFLYFHMHIAAIVLINYLIGSVCACMCRQCYSCKVSFSYSKLPDN